MIANFSVFLNNLGHKVAIIDLDSNTPLKLKNVFPQSIQLQEYEDLRQIISSGDSRYQKTFYFTDTQQISYFPAKNLSGPELLFHDAALRDFFLQTRATFDTLFINFPSGDKYCLLASELVAQNHLWQGNKPSSIIISSSEASSLIKLDGITRKASALPFQLRENTLILFNRVPGSLEEQKLSDTALTSSEIKKLFNFPNTFFIGHNEEFPHQKNIAAPIVLKSDSLIHQSISRLNRLLSKAWQDFDTDREVSDLDFLPCLDGALLEKLSPYLERIQIATAARLLIAPADVQIFLEESHGLFRIRVRLTGQKQKILKVANKIEDNKKLSFIVKPSPKDFGFRDKSVQTVKQEPLTREKTSNLSVKQIYRFDDRFSSLTHFEVSRKLDFNPQKGSFPSPIFLRHCHEIPEVPSLSQILGFVRKKFKRFPFVYSQSSFSLPGVTHFFIPPEFPIHSINSCHFFAQDFIDISLSRRNIILHESGYAPAFKTTDALIKLVGDLPDYFARSQNLYFEPDFSNVAAKEVPIVFSMKTILFNCFNNSQICIENHDFFTRDSLPKLDNKAIIPKILQLSEEKEEEEKSSSFVGSGKESRTWFKKSDNRLVCEVDSLKNLPLNLNQIALKDFSPSYSKPIFTFDYSGIGNAQALEIKQDFTKVNYISLTDFIHLLPDLPVCPIEPSFKPRVGSFKYEAVLIDHHLKVELISNLQQTDQINTQKSDPNTKMDFRTFFPAGFSKTIIRTEKTRLELSRGKEFKPIFYPPARELKRVRFRLPANIGNHYWDILQISQISTTDHGYVKMPLEKAYKSENLLDHESKHRNFSAKHSKMLDIKKPKNTGINLGFKKQNNQEFKLKQVFSKSIQPLKLCQKNVSNLPSAIEIAAKKASHEFSKIASIFSTGHFSLGSLKFATVTAPAFYAETPVIYTIPYHKFRSSLFSYKFSTSLDKIFEPDLSPLDQKAQLSVAKKSYQYFVEASDLGLPKKLPARAKQIALPRIEDSFTKIPLAEIHETGNFLNLIASTGFSFLLAPSSKNLVPSSTKFATFANYPFFKPLIDVEAAKKSRDLTIKVIPPDPLTELYLNLIRKFKRELENDLQMQFKTFSIKPTDFGINHVYVKLHFKDRIFFVRRILHSPDKLYFSSQRDFEITNPKLKDLFKLARQTSRKFMEVNNRSIS